MMTLMQQETRQAPALVARQLQQNQGLWHQVAVAMQQRPIDFVVTVARGSSDHAATFAKYLFETYLGLPVVSAAPSVQTLYRSQLKLRNALVIGLSQSGKSPDICEVLQQAREQEALTVAIVNQTDSPLAKIAEHVIPQHAGEEKAVAATKSYIATLSALVQGVAMLAVDPSLLTALPRLPERIQQALDLPWQSLVEYLLPRHDALTLGRGFGFPIAQEAALKFKETCRLHAEAFSSAEVLHGPFALMQEQFPVLQFVQNDITLESNRQLAAKMQALGTRVFMAMPKDLGPAPEGCQLLALPESLHGVLDPIVAITAFYRAVEQLAVLRGFNPDQPENLKKVTETR